MPSSERKTTRLPCAELEVAPGLADRVPVDDEAGIGRRRRRHRLRRQPAEHRHCDAGDGDDLGAARQRDQQPAGDVAEQDRDEGSHLDHAVAAGELALVQMLRQVGELDRAEQRRVQPHQEDAGEQDDHVGTHEAPRGERHDGDLEPLDEADQARLLELVGELAAGRREEQERQDEQRADDETGERRRQPGDLQLVGDQDRERELEQVVVAGAEELGPEEGREAALAEQRELVRMLVRRAFRHAGGNVGVAGQAVLPSLCARARCSSIWYRSASPRHSRSSERNIESTVTVSMAIGFMVLVVRSDDCGAHWASTPRHRSQERGKRPHSRSRPALPLWHDRRHRDSLLFASWLLLR